MPRHAIWQPKYWILSAKFFTKKSFSYPILHASSDCKKSTFILRNTSLGRLFHLSCKPYPWYRTHDYQRAESLQYHTLLFTNPQYLSQYFANPQYLTQYSIFHQSPIPHSIFFWVTFSITPEKNLIQNTSPSIPLSILRHEVLPKTHSIQNTSPQIQISKTPHNVL